MAKMGTADAGEGDMFVAFETWEDNVLWPALTKEYGTTTDQESGNQGISLKVSVTTPRTSALRADVEEAEVVSTRVLTAEGEPLKKHIEIQLPSETSYRAGDYLAVLPINPRETVARVLRKFELPWDSHLTIEAGSHVPLPTNASLPASVIFGAYVELAQPATKRVCLPQSIGFACTDQSCRTFLPSPKLPLMQMTSLRLRSLLPSHLMMKSRVRGCLSWICSSSTHLSSCHWVHSWPCCRPCVFDNSKFRSSK